MSLGVMSGLLSKAMGSARVEGGLDADLLDSRVSLSLTAYRKTTDDALVNVPLAPSVYGDQMTVLGSAMRAASPLLTRLPSSRAKLAAFVVDPRVRQQPWPLYAHLRRDHPEAAPALDGVHLVVGSDGSVRRERWD